MTKKDLAKNVAYLAEMLCISLEEAWNDHVDESEKAGIDFKEIQEICEKELSGDT